MHRTTTDHADLEVRERTGDGEDGRTITATLMRYGEVFTPAPGMRERFAPGSIDPDALAGMPLMWRHGEPVGVITRAHDDGRTVTITARVSDTATGRDAATLVRDRAVTGVSIGFEPIDAATLRDGTTEYRRVRSLEASLTPLPAYESARVHSIREVHPMPETTETMPGEVRETAPATAETAPVPVVRAEHDPRITREDLERLTARIDAVTARRGDAPADPAHPFAQYRTLGHYMRAVFTGAETRALAQVLPADVPGIMPPSWLTDLRGLVNAGRPFISALGGPQGPGDGGLDVSWPYTDSNLATLVGVQSAPGAAITSVKVPIKRGTASLATYAGGDEVALQVIERSSPEYLAMYGRIMAAAYATVTDFAAIDAAEAIGTGVGAADGTGAATNPGWFEDGILEASLDVLDATGSPAEVIAVPPAVYSVIAAARDTTGRRLYALGDGVNADGSIGAGGVGLRVAGIPVVRSTAVAAARAVVTNRAALAWLEDGPRTIDGAAVGTLGRDVAVYGYGVGAGFIPAGIVKVAITLPAALKAAAAPSSK